MFRTSPAPLYPLNRQALQTLWKTLCSRDNSLSAADLANGNVVPDVTQRSGNPGLAPVAQVNVGTGHFIVVGHVQQGH